MAKKLIIIESKGKIDSYKKYVGSDYDVVASFGHVIDLPVKEFGIDIKKDFEPDYVVMPDKKEVLYSIVEKAKKCDEVYLMTDPDREGEAIAYHISTQIPKSVKCWRASTSSINKSDILNAIKNRREIDMKMVDSQETRRFCDRFVGYKCSFPVQQATGGKSAGRVQSAALRILAEREKQIRAFKPEEYWPVIVELLTPRGEKVTATVIDPDQYDTKTEALAKKVVDALKSKKAKVDACDVKQRSANPSAPFTTGALQGTAANLFRWSQDKTMTVAQKLYEGGFITYMRTDSTHIHPDYVQKIRSEAGVKYGDAYLPDKPVVYKGGKNAQEAHEAVRPTDFAQRSVSSGDEAKLYELIWKRSVASQMLAAKYEQTKATFKVDKIVMSANGSRQLFDGFKKCWSYSDNEDNLLPLIKIGEECQIIDVRTEQKFTQPPPRYGVASFIKQLEDDGIGRPSTLRTITKTLEDRGYVEVKKNVFHVTDMGVKVVDFLVKTGFCFIDLGFTQQMEDNIDEIIAGDTTKLAVLKKFWDRLKEDLKRAQDVKKEASVTNFDCPLCKGTLNRKLVQKHSKFGAFFSCEGYSDKDNQCKYTAQVGEDGQPKEKEKKPPAKESEHECPLCQSKMVFRTGKASGKEFLGCPKWGTKKDSCKAGLFDLDGNPIEFKKKVFKKWKKKD